MARMIPPVISDAPPGETILFERFRDDPDTQSWVVLHSLDIARHRSQVAGEADFVVIVPRLGVLCIEVKSHLHVRRLADGQWVLGRDPPTDRSPFKQAASAMYSLRRFLKSSRIDLRNVPFWSAVWFPRLRASLPPNPEWHEWQVLDIEDLRRGVGKAVERVLGHGRQHLAEMAPAFDEAAAAPSEATSQAIAQFLRPHFEVAVSPADLRRRRRETLAKFTDEQFDALDQMDQARRVLFTGPAGSGKTFLALEAARRAAARDQSVRMLCFNALLGDWLKAGTAHRPQVQAGTLHAAMLGLAGIEPPASPGDGWWSGALVDAALEKLLDDPKHAADLLIVDEAQDLCREPYLDIIDLMVQGGLTAGLWLMFGDFERQTLYGAEDGREHLAERISDFAPFRLTWNCRNTPRIGKTAVFLAHMEPGYRRFRRPDDGFDPDYLPYDTPEQQQERLAAAVRRLLNDNFGPDEITVLSPRRDSAAQRCIDPWLSARLAPLGRNPKLIQYGTVHAFKGLDAPAVILTDIDDVSGAAAEALFYVGLTRATDRLVIIARRDALQQILQSRSR
jgi:hypothetical protein